MDEGKRKRLEAKGWKTGSAGDFLQLTEEEEKLVELRLLLRQSIRSSRKEKKLTQEELAGLLGSSQPRIAKMESGDSSVSLDFLFRSLFVLGASFEEIARLLSEKGKNLSKQI